MIYFSGDRVANHFSVEKRTGHFFVKNIKKVKAAIFHCYLVKVRNIIREKIRIVGLFFVSVKTVKVNRVFLFKNVVKNEIIDPKVLVLISNFHSIV